MSYLGPAPTGVSKGGTGDTTITGVVIGSGTSAFTGNAIGQFATLVGAASNGITSVGTGSLSQILLSNGSSANPSFASSGALVQIATQIANGGATINFTSNISSSFKNYLLRFYNVYPTSTGTLISINLSADNGVTWQSSNYLGGMNYNSTSGVSVFNVNSTSTLPLLDNQTSSGSDYGGGSVYFFNCQSGQYCSMVGLSTGYSGSVQNAHQLVGTNTGITGVNAIQITQSGGITGGTFNLYGIREY